jgi:transcriptional regulator with GAF, ATPase, and Fis domain
MPLAWLALGTIAFLAVLWALLIAARTRLQTSVAALAKAFERVAADGDLKALETTTIPGEIAVLRDAARALGAAIKAKSRSQVRTQRLLHLTGALSRALTDADDEITLLERFCRVLVLVGGYRFVWLGFEYNGELHRITKFSYSAFEDLDPYLLWSLSQPEGMKDNELQSLLKTAQWQLSRRASSASTHATESDACTRVLSTVALPLRLNQDVAGVVLICSDDEAAFEQAERRALTQMTANLALRLGKLHDREILIGQSMH